MSYSFAGSETAELPWPVAGSSPSPAEIVQALKNLIEVEAVLPQFVQQTESSFPLVLVKGLVKNAIEYTDSYLFADWRTLVEKNKADEIVKRLHTLPPEYAKRWYSAVQDALRATRDIVQHRVERLTREQLAKDEKPGFPFTTILVVVGLAAAALLGYRYLGRKGKKETPDVHAG